MASRQARQERQLERQRGAGRQVKDANLQLVFANPELQPQLSSRRASRAKSSHRPSSHAPSENADPKQGFTRTTATPTTGTKRPRGRPSLSTSRKRPRLTNESSAPPAEIDDIAEEEHEAGIPRSQKRKKRKSIGQQSRRYSKVKQRQEPEEDQPVSAKKRGRPRSSVGVTQNSGLDERIQQQLRVETSDIPTSSQHQSSNILQTVEPTQGTGHTPHQKRKKTISIGQQSRTKPREALAEVKEEPIDQSRVTLLDIPEDTEGSQDQLGDDGIEGYAPDDDEFEEQEDEDSDVQETSKPNSTPHSAPRTKRKKRKSIGQQRPKRPSKVASGLPLSKSKVQTKRTQAEPKRGRAQHEQRQHSAPVRRPSQATAPSRRVSRGRPKKSEGHETLPTSQGRSHKEVTRPAKIPPNAVPITVYREPAGPSDDSELEDGPPDPLRLYHATKPKTFNAVDVLAQVTLERLSTFAGKLQDSKAMSRTQRKALELYTEEVEVRLRRLSKALDRSKGLGLAVKQLDKEERALKGQVKEIEGKRKEVQGKLKEMEDKQKDHELGELLYRIGEVAKKCWEMERGA